ncbi:MAG: DNA mismatch repair endonuclease MutL [Bacteroidetes bacterium]|uniref:DNA mismatch repair protein MutL n=1 Tax=Candidatus Cryptobacteroides merdigallinarum TaxID=2840770 RepID=A0A9D9HCR5_9BACT|nr:DNA mismatch repair endonuclease MutL [Candidatus Cryptobacteroides merdigallinarum]
MDIRILPSNIANMIAAGEVVQRPASVVKELMENAVDAGADTVTVAVQDAGRTLIQVMDNGCGMSPDEAVLCFERHATSKIASVEDLSAIQTFGFRGEALASIAAVAEVTLKTRREEDELGCEVVFSDSRHLSTREVSTPRGANFAVRNLFYNVPARRKFIKSDNVEMKHIVTEFLRIALTRPYLNLTLTSNGREVYVLKKANSLKFRIQDLLGSPVVNSVVDIFTETSVVNISGYAGRPDAARKNQGNQYFFVNGRYFRSPYLHKAVMNAYGNLLQEGVSPAYFIYLEVDPHTMDVNISPTKTEVKFEEDNVIFQTLYACIKEALGKSSFGDAIDFDREGAPEIPVLSRKYRETHPVADPGVDFNPGYNPFEHDGFPSETSPYSNTLGYPGTEDPVQAGPEHPVEQAPVDPGGDFRARGSFAVDRREDYGKLFEDKTLPSTQTMVLKGKYILTPVKSGVMIVNIRRARERILYEANMKSLAKDGKVTQESLFPVTVRIGVAEMYLFSEYRHVLETLGFDIEPADNGAVTVNGVPQGFSTAPEDVEKMLPELIMALSDDHLSASEGMLSSLAGRLAWLGSVNSNPVRTQVEAQRLIDDLFACTNTEFTESGHRIVSVLTEDEIAKMFG